MYSKIDLSNFNRLKGPRWKQRLRLMMAQLPDRWLIVLGICYLAGAFIGVRAIEQFAPDIREGIVSIFGNFMEIRAEQSLKETAVSSFMQNFYLIAILFLLGFCAISLPFIPLIVLFKGMGYGVTMSALLEYGAKGGNLLLLALLIVPFSIASACIVVVAAKQSARLSVFCFRALRDGRGDREMGVDQYCRTFFLLVLYVAFFAAADALIYSLLAPGIFV